MNQTIPNSDPPLSHRDYYESTAARGDEDSIAFLAALPSLPKPAAHLWGWFVDPVSGLHATRQTGGMGVSRLTRAEIRQWQADELIPLESWERRALLALDAAWVKAANEHLNTTRDGGQTNG